MQSGSIRLFNFAGIEVSLHFTWFLVALWQLTSRQHGYVSPLFAVYEYIALFVIVLLHEFGHAFACRQVGGTADRILLWPFGGIAFVRPPPRPGAELWSIAAGPLVNVALVPVLMVLQLFVARFDTISQTPDLFRLVVMISYINIAILIFNLLPVYPLDGGQILRSLLWYPLGRIKSLRIASVVGLIGGGLFVLWALSRRSIWLILLTLFLLSQAINGWRHAQALQLQEEEARERPPVL